ncbi:hypothetical protein D3C81_893360 [compost metagenome]
MPEDRAGQVGWVDIGLRFAGTVVWLQVSQADIAIQTNCLDLAYAIRPAQQGEAGRRVVRRIRVVPGIGITGTAQAGELVGAIPLRMNRPDSAGGIKHQVAPTVF